MSLDLFGNGLVDGHLLFPFQDALETGHSCILAVMSTMPYSRFQTPPAPDTSFSRDPAFLNVFKCIQHIFDCGETVRTPHGDPVWRAGSVRLGEFSYEHEGKKQKFSGFVAVLGYSRMRYVQLVKRCDTSALIRCLMDAFEYFGGLTKVALTDRMKSVLLEMVENQPRWNPKCADFMVSIGVTARVCKPYTPQTKGKVERTVSYVKQSFWAGITFSDLDDLNRQARLWCERINARVHRTTHARPVERLAEEHLSPLPADYAWERFATEERKVTWDGYVSYDGVLYGLPAEEALVGPSGTGKTHLSLALADLALQAGHSVLFTTFADLALALESASHPG